MIEDGRDTLQRALRDLCEGVRALLGQPARLEIVSELLGSGGVDPRRRPEAAALGSRQTAPRPPRPVLRRVLRRRGSAVLAVVK